MARLFRATGWLGLAAIVVLSLVPAQIQVVTPLPPAMEHALAYFLAALVFALGYRDARERLVIVLAFSAAAIALELVQLTRDDRTATMTDVVGSAAGALAGVLAGRIAERASTGRARRSRRTNSPPRARCGSDPARSAR